MSNRKLQIFLSSTYEDLVQQRLVAMEAILAAGHIPAAMEQFSPGDDTAWERITGWIDESDAFILILGGRYGSLEPESGKSYVEKEYDYANSQQKPFFALVVDDEHHKERVEKLGLDVDERANQAQYKAFKDKVTQRLCKFWTSDEMIKSVIFQKLPEWSSREDLNGWVRASEAQDPALAGELVRLSGENRDLREQLSSQAGQQGQEFGGLTFDEMVKLLKDEAADSHVDALSRLGLSVDFLEDERIAGMDAEARALTDRVDTGFNLGLLFEAVAADRSGLEYSNTGVLADAVGRLNQRSLTNSRGSDAGPSIVFLSETGSRFYNRLSLLGDLRFRLTSLWLTEPSTDVAGDPA